MRDSQFEIVQMQINLDKSMHANSCHFIALQSYAIFTSDSIKE